jgi:uncharacterized membrane protein
MSERNETGCIEAFDDGVFSDFIALLVITVKVPIHELVAESA